MITDCNLIAYEYAKDQFTPKPIYVSGEKDEDSLIDKYRINAKELPVLILDYDIINKDGYGLKKGFYNVIPDEYMDFLLIFQTGKLKAKIPVTQMEVFESVNPKQQKVKKMSPAQYQRYLKKEEKRYYKGENPDELEWNDVEIHYSNEQNSYLLIYNSKNIRLLGVIKF